MAGAAHNAGGPGFFTRILRQRKLPVFFPYCFLTGSGLEPCRTRVAC